MKFTVVVLAACVFAGALAIPVSKPDHVRNLTDNKESLLKTIKELVESHSDLVRKIEAGEASELVESLQKAAERINEELRRAFKELKVVYSDTSSEPSDGEGLSRTERLRRRISEIRKAITSATAELAKIIWEQAKNHGGKLSDSLSESKAKVVQQITDLKDELLEKLRELMIPDDDVPVNYVIDEVFEQIIAGLKNQIQDSLKVISDWHNLLTESGRAKIAAAKKRITELAQKIADTIREWREQKESGSTTESSMYASDSFFEGKIIAIIGDLIGEFVDELEHQKLEVSKSSVETERDLLVHLGKAETQLSSSIESIREMVEEVLGASTASSNIIANLRKLLGVKMQQLHELVHGSADGEKIKALEKEIVNIRRRLIEAIQNVFKKP